MVLTPVKRSRVPSPLDDAAAFDEFVTQYLNKCDDLLSYTQRYPTVKELPHVKLQRQNRNPHETHRWLRRTVYAAASYERLKRVLFAGRLEHMPQWMPNMLGAETVEPLVPNLCDVVRLAFRSPGLRAKRDYCQLVVKREFVGEAARPKPRIFTPSASMSNLAQAFRSQSSANLAGMADFNDARDPSPYGHTRSASVRHLGASGEHTPNQFAGLAPHQHQSIFDTTDDEPARPVRRFQVVSVPVAHPNCTAQRGFVRAVYESYEEIREYADGRVEWVCIYHSDFAGWVPGFMADHAIAQAFPKEAEALLDYVNSA